MTLLDKITIAYRIIQAKLFKKRIPLVITWHITYRCNLKCEYCGIHSRHTQDLNTKEIFSVIDEVAQRGTKLIKFSGGEPLIREDINDVVSYCRSKGIYVLLNSNGILIKKRIATVRQVKEVQFGFDGPKSIHDSIRGPGNHDDVLEAIEICKKYNVNVGLTSVLSQYNMSSINYILEIAKKYKIGVSFQPVTYDMSNMCSRDTLRRFNLNGKQFKDIISFLIQEKKNGNPHINHSMSSLRHLLNWPEPRVMNCFQEYLCCSLEPDGSMFVCVLFPQYKKYLIPFNGSFMDMFSRLRLPHACKECWANNMEVNMLGDCKIDVFQELWKRFNM